MRKDIVNDILNDDVNEQTKKITDRLRRQGTINDDEKNKLLEAIADGYDDVARILDGD